MSTVSCGGAVTVVSCGAVTVVSCGAVLLACSSSVAEGGGMSLRVFCGSGASDAAF